MKKENDEITDLFRTRLADAGMAVRDGFWEELSQDIPVACQHRRRLIFFRVAAAASVLLVLAASSATFWYFSPKEEMEEAFTKKSWWQTAEEWMEMGYVPISCRRQWNRCCRNRHRNHSVSVSTVSGRRGFSFHFILHVIFSSRQRLLPGMVTDTVTRATTVTGRRIMVTQDQLTRKEKNIRPICLLR